MVTTSRHDRPRRDEHDIYHLTLLAESTEGYKNLIKVSSQRVPRRLLPEAALSTSSCSSSTATGLIATTGCLGGAV